MSIIDNIRKRNNGFVRAVMYARYSSDMQRDESIDAQLRAINDYAVRNEIVIIGQYIDKAQSAKTSQREQFQQMITDSRQHNFDIVLVHKLDRFARNRADSMYYRTELKKNKVSLISVLEYIDDSPESIILESVLEAMAEYYSKNLAREVFKGMKENALQGKHTGGKPPLGYDVDPVTKRFVINEIEAQAVRLIYQRHLEGIGYKEICRELNRKGYKTKRNADFCTNSLYEILRNERYTGTAVYNKIVSRDDFGKRNRHEYKEDDEIIRCPDAFPAIINREQWDMVQYNTNNRKRISSNHAIETYLLTGKIICGECGGSFVGCRKISAKGTITVSYKCNIYHRYNGKCHNKSINRDMLEDYVLTQLSNIIFDDTKISEIVEMYNASIDKDMKASIQKQINDVNKKINNVIDVISETASTALIERLQTLEKQKDLLQMSLLQITDSIMTIREMTDIFQYARQLLLRKDIPYLKELIQLYVDKIIIDETCAKVYFKFSSKKKQIDCT